MRYAGDEALLADEPLPDTDELLDALVLLLTELLEPMPRLTVEVLLVLEAEDLSELLLFIAGAVVWALSP